MCIILFWKSALRQNASQKIYYVLFARGEKRKLDYEVEASTSTRSVSDSKSVTQSSDPEETSKGIHQPESNKAIPSQEVNYKGVVRQYYFNCNWFKKHPWLHYTEELKGVLCYVCCEAIQKVVLSSSG